MKVFLPFVSDESLFTVHWTLVVTGGNFYHREIISVDVSQIKGAVGKNRPII